MKTHKKGAIELSMNFLVIIIISIVLLGMGITFAARLFSGAIEKKAELDKATEQRIEELLSSSGDPVIIPITRKDVSPGGTEIFGLGVKNNNQIQSTFNITVIPGTAVDRLGNKIADGWDADWKILYERTLMVLAPNERMPRPIGITSPKSAQDGTYSFTVTVRDVQTQQTHSIKIFVGVS